MKVYKLLMLSVVILLALVSVSAVCSSDSNGQIVNGLNSVSDVNQALNDAQHSNKSVLLIFDQDSCYYCERTRTLLGNSHQGHSDQCSHKLSCHG